MDKKQFMYLIAALKSNYRNFGVDSPEQISFWYDMLKDLDYNLAEIAVKTLISESPHAPTISDIRKAAAHTKEELPVSATAWGEVMQAIKSYGIYQQEKALESMSPLTRKVVKAMGFKELCLSENMMADRAHFQKMFDTMIKREEHDRVIPIDVKEKTLLLRENQEKLRGMERKLLEGMGEII